MVKIMNPEHFRETYHFAKQVKDPRSKQSFLKCIQLINRIKRRYQGTLYILPDWVPFSFQWAIRKDDKLVYNGGIECHGGNWTQGSITLELVRYLEWRVHT